MRRSETRGSVAERDTIKYCRAGWLSNLMWTSCVLLECDSMPLAIGHTWKVGITAFDSGRSACLCVHRIALVCKGKARQSMSRVSTKCIHDASSLDTMVNICFPRTSLSLSPSFTATHETSLPPQRPRSRSHQHQPHLRVHKCTIPSLPLLPPRISPPLPPDRSSDHHCLLRTPAL